ncbi:PREDICTED: probable ATP-dependent RNA helicase ddx42 isoform X2 [Camelina sativa]|uniref:Probable ATP-dependent RNA helicase ddx42 isoform X1 n=1 Tax=Camelina sativa TaxID=90675 RepID=A0ABM0VSW9_CAMSA|nr:PREDICTED: probable ATP-dependent RNA helicase ddx42 isoform X1 [Camelina sativa]XP_010460636.1 PREDICTED: probable ATP-dependent RNA helicase ddx42 isoform X2 [Camelina sativa]
MAFSTRSSLFFFFTTLILLSTQIHARDSYFFGKFHRDSPKDQNPNNVLPLETSEKTTVDESIPNKKEQEQDPTFVPESGNGYGLYGHETTYNDNKEEFNNNNKYDDKVNSKTFSTPSLSETEESFNNYDEKYPKDTESYGSNGYNNEEFNNNNNNKYNANFKEEFNTNNKYDETPKEEFNNKYANEEFNNNNNNKYDENVKEESFSQNNGDNKRSFYNSNAYGTELERETPYKGYSHNLERQGMSDTRFMEKGSYYYDLYNARNHGHYYRKPHSKSPAGFYSSPATETNYDQQSYSYGNNNNDNEENSFKDPYNSEWENEQTEEFVAGQGTNQFKP